MKYIINIILCCLFLVQGKAQPRRMPEVRKNILLDSIRLSDPFILADAKTNLYYLTGTGGMLWKSKDLEL